MAMGRYSRVDGRKSSSCCSSVTVLVFVSISLVGLWMLMSSSASSVENSESQPQDIASQVKNMVSGSWSKLFEDSSGDLSEDAIKENDKGLDFQNSFSDSETDQPRVKSREESEDNKDDIEDKHEMYSKETQSTVDASSTVHDETQSDMGSESSSADDAQNGSNLELGDGEKNNEEKSNDETGDKETESKEEKKSDEAGDDDNENKEKRNDESGNIDGDNKEEKNTDPEVRGNETKEDDIDSNQSEDTSENPSEEPKKLIFPAVAQTELLNEASAEVGSWSTQAAESRKEIESQHSIPNVYTWKVCNVTAGPDYIPCLDNWNAIRKLVSTNHYEHRERHCPEEAPTCLVPLPSGYRRSIAWPLSREKIWFSNVPNTKLAEVKGHQNWVKVTGDYLTFPGGGTQFVHGALHYIDFIQNTLPSIAWGKTTRVILDVGCGVASFGGFLFDRDVVAMSLAPKDEHEAQVQFALERGIPAILAVMGTKRLPFPSSVFDAVHCARCRVPWHIEGGKLLLELNRLLRPGGYFVWSATPIYQNLTVDVEIWKAMTKLTKQMCWERVSMKKDELNNVGIAMYRKPTTNECYDGRSKNSPPLCDESNDANAAWNVDLNACMHRVPVDSSVRGSRWPEKWPKRLEKPPYWLKSQAGVYGRAAPEDFTADYKHWKNVVSTLYMNGLGFNLSSVRNGMDMNAVYGGFAAALRDLQMWVMNVVPIDSPDTLPVIYERGLFGMYHNWCESFNTYPRTYDLLHADKLFSSIKTRCKLAPVIAEVDRILRPEGKLIVRDNIATINELENIAKSLHWEIRMSHKRDEEGVLCLHKKKWRPSEQETILSAIQ